jgi:hypothetical protein
MIYQQWIKDNAENLIEEIVADILHDKDTSHYRKLIPQDLVRERIRNVFYDGFQRLQDWLQKDKENEDIFRPYIELGRERCREGAPMEEVIRVFMKVSRKINMQIEDNKVFDTRYRLDELAELNRNTALFFSRIVHAIIMGYEEEHGKQA